MGATPNARQNGVFRAEVIFEDHPFRCPVGEVSSDPAAKRPIFLGTDFCPECGAVMEDGCFPEDCVKSSEEDSE